MPDQINKVLVEGTTYEITPSSTGTFDGTSEDDASPSSWTTVSALTSGETNGSIFTKISQMFKNIRFLYGKLGTVDISTTGSSITDAIANLETNKADINHSHSVATTAAAGFMPVLEDDTTKYLRSDGTWVKPAGEEYSDATTAVHGLMSTSDKVKLNSVETSANNYVHPTHTSYASGLYKVVVDGTGHISGATAVAKADITALGIPGSDTNTTYATFTSVANGLVPAAKSGTTNYATTGYVLTGAGWAAGTKYNTDNNTTYAVFTGSTTAAAGANGLVPAPTTAQVGNYFLKHNKTWASPTNTTYAVFTSAANGLVPAAKSGSTSYLTSGYVLTGAGWKAGTKYNTDTTYSTNASGVKYTWDSTSKTLTLNALTVRV